MQGIVFRKGDKRFEGLSAQEAVRSATLETFMRWWVKWQKQNAEAISKVTRTGEGKPLEEPGGRLLYATLLVGLALRLKGRGCP